ncbi:MAG TPA: hypothetical protein VFL34_00500 [Candidatus Sulfotelmatobacter sp.]|nr:hypothetical protein [Candidatus Sulfotelmatobacter sp.]
MRVLWQHPPLGLLLSVLIIVFPEPGPARAGAQQNKSKLPVVRWDETRPGCTFSRRDDGRSYYGVSEGDLGITLGIDTQELQLVHHRHVPFFAALLTMRYKGQAPIDVSVDDISLEFVKHFRVVQTALDPDGLSQKVQSDADELEHQTAREVAKHPEKKAAKEDLMRAFLKDTAELQEFLGKNSLRPAQLGPDNREDSGWVMFSADSKWISGWKKPEELILRVPVAGKIFEFPFTLPPKAAEVILRRRQ